jgi:hypothetical protein
MKSFLKKRLMGSTSGKVEPLKEAGFYDGDGRKANEERRRRSMTKGREEVNNILPTSKMCCEFMS